MWNVLQNKTSLHYSTSGVAVQLKVVLKKTIIMHINLNYVDGVSELECGNFFIYHMTSRLGVK